MKKTLVVVFAALAFASCGGSSSSSDDGDGGNIGAESEKKVETPDSFASTSDMRDALNVAGLTCLDFRDKPKEDRAFGEESAVGVSVCEVEGEEVELVVWKDNGQRDNYNSMGKTLGCSMGEAFGVTNFDWVHGEKWHITGPSLTLAKQIEDRLGGKAYHHDC
jgi:hypothetical protein